MSSAEEKMLELKVPNPTPGPEHHGTWFVLYIPQNLEPEEQWEQIRWHIEFRRKCMNQGFDNLLELLKQTCQNIMADAEAEKRDREAKP